MTSRDLELAEAIAAASPLEQRVLAGLYGPRDEVVLAAVDAHREVLSAQDEQGPVAPELRARLAVLLLESGQPEEARHLLAEDPLDGALFDLLAGASPGSEEALRDQVAAAGLSGWYADRVLLRLLPPERTGAIRSELLARGEVWKRRSLSLLASNLLLVAFGAAVVATRVRFLRELLRGRDGAPPWSLADGLGVFVRGDFWNRLYFLALVWALGEPFAAGLAGSGLGVVLQTWGTLFASLPLLWLVHRHLLSPAGRSATRSFGLDVPFPAVARVALCAIAMDLLGTHALAWTAWGIGAPSSWAEGFDEMLVWGSPADALLTTVDYVVWAPAMEELAFRGVLYYSLRHRLAPLPAAIATASFFASLHFYSLPGFGMTLWSGFVWALAFERLRSVLPGAGAHAVYNALYVAGLLLVYR
jgi:membrane protease YdiL (CAAX protease family)